MEVFTGNEIISDNKIIGNPTLKDTKITFGGINNILFCEKNVIIGDDCLFSLGLFFRTSDVHIIYDASSKKRINNAKSILIGDHVWLGQNVLELKGAKVSSGTIIGANSLISNKIYYSNCLYAGKELLKENVIFDGISSHKFTSKENEVYDTVNKDILEKYNYQSETNSDFFDKLDIYLSGTNNTDKKLKCLNDIYKKKRERFAINK